MAKTKTGSSKAQGSLIIIGGRESKKGETTILEEVAKRVGSGKLCIATVASSVGEELWEEYRKVFKSLGVKKISHLDVVQRHEAINQVAEKAVHDATGVFFTGGDQLKITSELGGTVIADRISKIYSNGGVIAGTSAGASVMGETMLVAGGGDASYRIRSGLMMAPGLGFVKNMIIDQHFAERGRIGRLMGAVAHNPKYLGIGIDENTAVVVESEKHFKVLGAGAVYVLDAREATDSNISEADEDKTLSIFNVRFHLLSEGDAFLMNVRAPVRMNGSKLAAAVEMPARTL